ncbi:unnamed protein product [Blepharisma stoltei]|uniref:Polycystin cation channel PKD1/PKD2 domain-containing protein n=1 Tax=Blepharisma stoltei TaxID=1481888 RepID=A0AAU9JJC6_9CILI|nr:unnamed protein product [Blepharisma stoltei]
MKTPRKSVKPLKNLSLRDQLYMPPLEKYSVFGIFPWAMVIHLLLVLFASCQVVLIINSSALYSYSQLMLWNQLFLNKDVQGSDTSLSYTFTLFRINKLQSYVQETVEKYYDINSHAIDNYSFKYNEYGDKKPVKMFVKYSDREKAKDKHYSDEYDLTTNDLGPFEFVNLKDFLDLVSEFQLQFTLLHHLNPHVDTASTCYEWTISQIYQYTYHGTIEVFQEFDRGVCHSDSINVFEKYIWLDILVLILSLSSIVITMLYLFNRALLISRLKYNPRATMAYAWDSLSTKEKLHFIDLWILVTIFGNLCQLFGSLSAFIDEQNVLNIHEIFIGFGCFFSWITIIRYLEPAKNAYTIVHTMQRAFPILGPYMVGILPVFMAFSFLSICLFWETGLYSSPIWAMIVNFCMLNGDSLYFFISADYTANKIFGQLYIYAFLVFFICCIHNIFIAIIQDGFASLQTNPIKQGGDSDEEADTSSFFSALSKLKKKKNQDKEDEIDRVKKSRKAFRKILTGRVSGPINQDRTQTYLERMEREFEDIKKAISSLPDVIEPEPGHRVDRNALKERMNAMLSKDIMDYADMLLTTKVF